MWQECLEIREDDTIQVMVWYDCDGHRRLNLDFDDWLSWYTIVDITKKELDSIMNIDYNRLESKLSNYI